MKMQADKSAQFKTGFQRMHENYDDDHHMVTELFDGPGFYSRLKNGTWTHPTRTSLSYAVGLLDTGLPEYLERAVLVIEKVMSLQETDPGQSTYGIWPWHLEEPLSQMSPPDWNWADFCGKLLLQVVMHHNDRLPSQTSEKIRACVFRACEAIIKRNVGPEYTNISIMGALVTLFTGEYYGNADMLAYGLERFRKFYEHTLRLGTFSEYNSPTYAVVVISDLAIIRKDSRTEEAVNMSERLLEIAWKMIAEHYHAPTNQWVGPHSRTYSSLLKPVTLSFLQYATGGALSDNAEDKVRYATNNNANHVNCPEFLLPLFHQTNTRMMREKVKEAPEARLERWASTYMTADYALSTFDKEIMWIQRRNLVGYIQNGDQPTYIHLRFLRDGYDYTSALFTSVQDRNRILFAFNFATDGGNTHHFIDRINGSVEASDVRMRLEIGGNLANVLPLISDNKEAIGDRVSVQIAGYTITLDLCFFQFFGMKPKWEWSLGEDQANLDLIIYSGEQRELVFTETPEAALIAALALEHTGQAVPGTSLQTDSYKAVAVFGDDDRYGISIPLKPDSQNKLMEENEARQPH